MARQPRPRPRRAREVAGRDLVTGLLRRTSVTSAQIRAALQQPLEHIVAAVKDVLDRTPPSSRPT